MVTKIKKPPCLAIVPMKAVKKDFSVCNIIGFKDPSGNFVINPKDDTEIIPNCKLIVLGSAEEILKLNQIFGIEH